MAPLLHPPSALCPLQRLATIVASVPALGPTSRVCDVGSGTGCLIPHMQARGVVDILAVDVAPGMLQQLRARYPDPGTCGNDPGEERAAVRTAQATTPSQHAITRLPALGDHPLLHTWLRGARLAWTCPSLLLMSSSAMC